MPHVQTVEALGKPHPCACGDDSSKTLLSSRLQHLFVFEMYIYASLGSIKADNTRRRVRISAAEKVGSYRLRFLVGMLI